MMTAARNIVLFLLRIAVLIGLGAGCFLLGMVLAIGAPQAKPLSSKPSSWPHIATPSPYGKPHSRSRKSSHRLPAEPAGWGASAEPTASANKARLPMPPLPARKPKKLRASVPHQKATARDKPKKLIKPAKAKTAASDAPDSVASIKSAEVLPKSEQEASDRAPNLLSPQTPLGSLDVAVTGVLGEDTNDENVKNAQDAPLQSGAVNKTAGAQFCDNISNAAADARFAWQKKLLKKTEENVSKRIKELDKRIKVYRKWLARRNDFSRKAQGVVVNIYSKMKPDAAAQQLTILDEEMAAAVLTKLSAKAASAVMNEMDPKHAARLTSIISGAMIGPDNAPPPPLEGSGT